MLCVFAPVKFIAPATSSNSFAVAVPRDTLPPVKYESPYDLINVFIFPALSLRRKDPEPLES